MVQRIGGAVQLCPSFLMTAKCFQSFLTSTMRVNVGALGSRELSNVTNNERQPAGSLVHHVSAQFGIPFSVLPFYHHSQHPS